MSPEGPELVGEVLARMAARGWPRKPVDPIPLAQDENGLLEHTEGEIAPPGGPVARGEGL